MRVDIDLNSIEDINNKLAQLKTEIFRKRIDELISFYGSYRKLSNAIGIDHAYLHRLAIGEKTNPSKDILKKLGLDT